MTLIWKGAASCCSYYWHASACRFGSAQSIPQVCRSLQKAAYDPRVCGVLLKVSPLSVRGAPRPATVSFLVVCWRTSMEQMRLSAAAGRLGEAAGSKGVRCLLPAERQVQHGVRDHRRREGVLPSVCMRGEQSACLLTSMCVHLVSGFARMQPVRISPPKHMRGCAHRRCMCPRRAT